MNQWKPRLLRSALDASFYTGIYRLLEPVWSGVGAIFTLHHISPENNEDPFSPNGILEIKPGYLAEVIQQVLELGYEVVTLDEVRRRLVEKDFEKKFVCFTLDDGYADQYQYAVPVFNKYKIPFTIYVTTGLPDGIAILWWRVIEDILRKENKIDLTIDDNLIRMPTRTAKEKYLAFKAIYWPLRQASHASQQATIQGLINKYSIDCPAMCRNSALSWEMLQQLSRNELATIGAHTVNHYQMNRLSSQEVSDDASQGREILMRRLGREPAHFSYPYGDRASAGPREFSIIKDLGFATATTTRKGVLFPEHREHLHALPRISLNGDYQLKRYIPLFLSGAPFALWNRFRRLNVN